jgi:two-component system, chemotaxis family, protein-glutamate methylesterase/glutaminase
MSGNAIAIGGSAGAIPVLKRLIGQLPPDLNAPVFVAVHIGSEGRNILADILDLCGPCPVRTAEEGAQVVPGTVYVAPADHHLLILDGAIRLGRGPRENMARPAIDPLFRSVAASHGPGALGVVLTGYLNDGVSGLASIKERGGLTVVQNPSDAEVPDMPLSALADVEVDYRAPSSDLPDLLTRLVAMPPDPAPASPVPPALRLEIDIALGRPCTTDVLESIADPVALSCPSCSGVLSQIHGHPLRFRCQVGHAYSAQALSVQQEGALDEALRVALRIVEERVTLLTRMAADALAAGRQHTHDQFRAKAQELRSQADILRKAALKM